MKAHIDGDILVYAIAGSCEGTRWYYKGSEYESKSQLNIILKEDGVTDAAVTVTKVPEPWESCRTSVISYLEGILEYLDMDYQIYLSGKGNFRYDVATILPYKGNRKDLQKPFHYDNIRQFLVDVYDAKVSEGVEADDMIGLNHDPEEDLIASLDKDLKGIPGLHYDWVKNKCYWVTDGEADYNFYSQVLTGDSIDNILGLYGVGTKSKLLQNLSELRGAEEMFNFVKEQYQSRFGSYWRQFMFESCHLLWILQRRDATWRTYFRE